VSRPTSPFVVFYGEPSESQDADLTGKLVLTSPESMSVKAIKLTLTGLRKVSYVRPLFALVKRFPGSCSLRSRQEASMSFALVPRR
jgi:hypothetical protein